MKKASEYVRIGIPLLVSGLIILVSLPRTANFPYNYKKGTTWKYENLVSQFDFPILKTQEQILKEEVEMTSRVVPYYKFNDEVPKSAISKVQSMTLEELDPYREVLVSSLKNIYAKGVLPDKELSSSLVYIQKDKRAVKYPSTEILQITRARRLLTADIESVSTFPNVDSLLRLYGVSELILPNLVFDEQATAQLAGESVDEVSPTSGFIPAGQLIVSKGEIVTAEVAQILDSYKDEFNNSVGYSRNRILLWLSGIVIVLIFLTLLVMSVLFEDSSFINDNRSSLFVLLVFTIASFVSLLLIKLKLEEYLFMVPFTLTALWLKSFFRNSLSFTVYAMSLLPLLVFAHSGLSLFVIFLVGGGIAIIFSDKMNRGWKQFLLSLIVCAGMLLAYSAMRLLDIATGSSLQTVIFLIVSSFSTIAIYPIVYLFERIFGLVSNSRLEELADTSNTLLRELEKKAPGTFQHSLQVANMADAAARAIGANYLLLRAGALYHDLGKMNNPQCFIENETLVAENTTTRYHEGLSPIQSARDISKHVSDGLEIAEKHHIPSIIKDFIITHHGKSCVTYFFNKYVEQGGSRDEKNLFTYDGRKPVSKEQAILMICDAVEAASRTLKDHSPEAYSAFVDKIAHSKMDQLNESSLTLNEFNIVKEVLKSFLAQIYHERIIYPKNKIK